MEKLEAITSLLVCNNWEQNVTENQASASTSETSLINPSEASPESGGPRMSPGKLMIPPKTLKTMNNQRQSNQS